MDTEQERQHPQAHLFTLRVWEETLGEDEAEWRGRVQALSSGETAFFRGWPGLVATLSRLLGHPEVPDGPRDGVSQLSEAKEAPK
jgi:hypothetical protein